MDNKIDTTVERILHFIEYKGISKREFAASVGISHSLIGKSSSIGSDKLEKILSEYPELNPIWLLSGKGSMIVNDPTKQMQDDFADNMQKKGSNMDNIISKNEDLDTKQNITENPFAKAMFWFAIESYASRYSANVSGNMFGELSSIFKTIGDFCQILQDSMFVEVGKSMVQVLVDKKNENPEIQDYIVTDEDGAKKDKIIGEYASLYNDIMKYGEDLPLLLNAIDVFMKTRTENKK